MSTITRERLRERAREKVKSLEFSVTQSAFADSRAELEEELELARIALASLEAEAVCYLTWHQGFRAPDDCEEYVVEAKPGDKSCDGSPAFPVYTAPPAQVSVPDDVMAAIQKVARIRLDLNDFDGDKRGILDCLSDAEEALIEVVNSRAAMLQGAKNAESRCSNSPVITDELIRRIAFSLVYLASDEKVRSDQDALNALVRAGVNEVRKELSSYA